MVIPNKVMQVQNFEISFWTFFLTCRLLTPTAKSRYKANVALDDCNDDDPHLWPLFASFTPLDMMVFSILCVL